MQRSCIDCDGTGWLEDLEEMTARRCEECNASGKKEIIVGKFDIHFIRNDAVVCGQEDTTAMRSPDEKPVTCAACLTWIRENAS